MAPDILESKLKKLSGKDKYPGRICISIAERSMRAALGAIKKANAMADLLELRLDYLSHPVLEELLPVAQQPVIVTNRSGAEGGQFKGKEDQRIWVLKRALELKAAFVDLELASEKIYVKEFLQQKEKTGLILSFHDLRRTPSFQELRSLLTKMSKLGADIGKIVTFAKSWADNLQVLTLLLYSRSRNQKLVAFCMGPKGKISRVVSPLLGGAWTYVALHPKKKCAPGQLTYAQLQEIWRKIA